jgi:hypothetical protein
MIKLSSFCSSALSFIHLSKHKNNEIEKEFKDPCPLLSLPTDLLSQVFSILSLQEIGRLSQINSQIFNFTKNKYIWKFRVKDFGIPIDDDSFARSLVIKDVFIKKFSCGTIDYIKKQVFFNITDGKKIVEESNKIFSNYIPKGYFLKDLLGFDSYQIIYRNEGGNISKLISPGSIKQRWNAGEEVEWKKVHKTMIEFTVFRP